MSERTDPTRHTPAGQPDEHVGAVFAERYEVLERIGEGGMGMVYLGRHVTLDRAIALKVLKPDLSENEEVVERFLREARAASRIGHEHIVDIIDVGRTASGITYFVMERLEGQELESLLDREGRLPWARARGILIQVARALGAAHQAGVIHRDMKPSNVFLIERGGNPDYVKLLDFGIAKIEGQAGLTQTGMIFGTVGYMAPEQAMGAQVDHRIDIYALGCLAFEMLVGRLPFEHKDPHKVLDMHIETLPPRPRALAPYADIPSAVEELILQALAKAPEDRLQTLAALVGAIAALPTDAGPRQARAGRKGPPRPQPRRAPIMARKMMTNPPIPTAGLGVPVPPELSLLATLYVSLADTDGVISSEETDLLVARLHEWGPELPRDEIGALLRHALADWHALATPEARRDRTRELALELSELLPRAQLAAVLSDLYEIAGIDGHVPEAELRVIVTVTKHLGLTPDPRLLATAYLYLTLGYADGVFDTNEERVLSEQVAAWSPGASEAEVGAVLRWASAEFERRVTQDDRLACAREAADQLSLSADDGALRQILAGLWRMAGADGHICVEEQQFIMDIVDRFGTA